jgi:CBS domain-containing protein
MLVSDFMQHGVARCRVGDSLQSAARTMLEKHCGFLSVVDDEGVLVGALTDRDVCMAAAWGEEPLARVAVAKAMSATVVDVCEHDEISRALDLMARHHVHRVPVLDSAGHPVGVLTLSDLARAAAPGWTAEAGMVTPSSVVELLAHVDEGRL